jgi:hypothetical protein
VRIEPIPARPGFAAIAADGDARISGLVGLLDSRPKLGVTLTGSAGPEDRDALAGQVLADGLDAGDPLPALSDQEVPFLSRRRISRALRDRAREEVRVLAEEDEERLRRYVERTDVPDDRFDELARKRAERIRERLATLEGVPPERIRVDEDRLDGNPGVALGFFMVE